MACQGGPDTQCPGGLRALGRVGDAGLANPAAQRLARRDVGPVDGRAKPDRPLNEVTGTAVTVAGAVAALLKLLADVLERALPRADGLADVLGPRLRPHGLTR